MVGDALEHVGEIRLGIKAVQACCAKQAVHHGGTFATGVGADDQLVPPSESHASVCSLGDQIVDIRTPIAAVVDERRAAIQRIPDRLDRVRFCRERGKRRFEPALHVVEQWHRSRLAHIAPFIRRLAADLPFDLVERADPAPRFLRHGAGAHRMEVVVRRAFDANRRLAMLNLYRAGRYVVGSGRHLERHRRLIRFVYDNRQHGVWNCIVLSRPCAWRRRHARI